MAAGFLAAPHRWDGGICSPLPAEAQWAQRRHLPLVGTLAASRCIARETSTAWKTDPKHRAEWVILGFTVCVWGGWRLRAALLSHRLVSVGVGEKFGGSPQSCLQDGPRVGTGAEPRVPPGLGQAGGVLGPLDRLGKVTRV